VYPVGSYGKDVSRCTVRKTLNLKETPQLLIVGDLQYITILLEIEKAQVQRISKEGSDRKAVVCNH
jgi:hypothetical protein